MTALAMKVAKAKMGSSAMKAVRKIGLKLKANKGSKVKVRVGKPLPIDRWPSTVDPDNAPRAYWLPADWGQGIKNTCRSDLRAFVSPEGKLYYHRQTIEGILGRKLGPGDGLSGAVAWAKERVLEGKSWQGQSLDPGTDQKLFACLSKAERAQLPEADEFLFCVVSARRAGNRESMRALVNTQAQLLSGGVTPRWYVDKPSIKEYRALGLESVVGGKLTPARNRALVDAARMGKVCVQMSDDISTFHYMNGELHKQFSLDGGNLAAKSADRFKVSAVAAARFLLAKMRASPREPKPRLGGLFPLGNTGQAFCQESVSSQHFILGDFFVDDNSGCRFDTSMTLKEDYDFTCTHLAKFGSVLRCNRMIAAARHETNPGGACSVRDSAGDRERDNINVLRAKWPGVFRTNPKRGDTQVIMTWRFRKNLGGC